jgi:hypothetical protein
MANSPIGTQPSTGEAAEKGFALFERSEFAKSRQNRGAQGIPPSAGQGTQGALSLVRFFWASKEMNKLIHTAFPESTHKKRGLAASFFTCTLPPQTIRRAGSSSRIF